MQTCAHTNTPISHSHNILSCSHIYIYIHTPTSISHTQTNTHTCSLSLSLSHTHTHKHLPHESKTSLSKDTLPLPKQMKGQPLCPFTTKLRQEEQIIIHIHQQFFEVIIDHYQCSGYFMQLGNKKIEQFQISHEPVKIKVIPTGIKMQFCHVYHTKFERNQYKHPNTSQS